MHSFNRRFRKLNTGSSLLHLTSGIIALLLTSSTAGMLAAFAGIVSSALHTVATTGITGRTNIYRYIPKQKIPFNIDFYRWIDYSISSTLMVAAIGSLVNLDTGMTIFVSIINSAMMVYSGYKEGNSSARSFGCTCIIYTAAVWLPIFLVLYNPPEFVYAIISGVYIAHVFFAVVYALHGVYETISTAAAEALYIVISLSAKIFIQWTIIGGAERSNSTVVYIILATIFAVGAIIARPVVKYLTTDYNLLDPPKQTNIWLPETPTSGESNHCKSSAVNCNEPARNQDKP